MPPEFRCLLCDLVLAEEGTPGTRRCEQCGKSVLIDQPSGSTVVPLMELTPPPIPTVAQGYLPKPSANVVDLASLPEAVASRPVRSLVPPPPPASKLTQFNPTIVPDPERPRPRLFKALFVLFLMVLAGIVAVTIIIFAIASGLKKAKKIAANNQNNTQVTPTTADSLPSTITKPTIVKPIVTGPSIWSPGTSTFTVKPGVILTPQTIQLPSMATEGIYAGNARFICWYLPQIEMIAVWDALESTYHGFIPAPGVRSHIAASANRLFVVSVDRGTVTSYKLTDLSLDKTRKITDANSRIAAAVAGHTSDSPLYLLMSNDGEHRLTLLDGLTLERKTWRLTPAPQVELTGAFANLRGDRAFLRCSANGKIVVAGVAEGKKDYQIDQGELSGEALIAQPVGKSSHPVGLTAEGKLMVDGRPAAGARFPMSFGSGYFTAGNKPGRVVLDFSTDVFVQRGDLEDAEGFTNRVDTDDEKPRDRWAFLVSAAKSLIYLSDDRREFKIIPVNIDASIKGTKLVISSAPPPFALRGEKWVYQFRTITSGPVQIRLDAAPENMTIDKNVITWNVPAETNITEARVELTVTSDIDPKAVARQSFAIAMRSKPFLLEFPQVKAPPELRFNDLKPERGDTVQFTGKPVARAKPGSEYRMSVKLTAPSESIKVAIVNGPAAIAWDGDAMVWKVPNDQPEGQYPVVIKTVVAEREYYQAFLLNVSKE